MKWDLWNTDTVITASRTSSTALNICCSTLTRHCSRIRHEEWGKRRSSIGFISENKKKITILSKQRHECHAKLTKMSILIWLNRFFKLERIFWCCDRQKERIACNFRIFWRLNHILSIFGILFFVILTYRYDRTVREVLDIEWHSVSSSSLSSMIDNESGKTLGCFDLSSANDRAWIISIIRHLQRMRE